MADRRRSILATLLLLTATLFGCRTAPPRMRPPAGTYNCPQTVTLTDIAPGASIFYTTDGTAPQPSSPKYAAPILVNNTQTVEAIAVARPRKPSRVASAQYICSQTYANRRDLAVLLQDSFKLPAPQQVTDFPDLTSTDPDYDAIEATAPVMNMQILCVGCMLNKNFGPDVQVSRAGSTIAIVRVLIARNQLQLVNITETNRILSDVADVDEIPFAARSYFATALRSRILTLNSDQRILLHTGYTRPELVALLEKLGKQFGSTVGTIR